MTSGTTQTVLPPYFSYKTIFFIRYSYDIIIAKFPFQELLKKKI